jgi:hypothetical protein
VPLVLLPIVPHLTTELGDEDAAKRLDALRLLCRLFVHREGGGRSLAADFGDVLDELLGRARDKEVRVRLRVCVFVCLLLLWCACFFVCVVLCCCLCALFLRCALRLTALSSSGKCRSAHLRERSSEAQRAAQAKKKAHTTRHQYKNVSTWHSHTPSHKKHIILNDNND